MLISERIQGKRDAVLTMISMTYMCIIIVFSGL
jgi:hypothetical protein